MGAVPSTQMGTQGDCVVDKLEIGRPPLVLRHVCDVDGIVGARLVQRDDPEVTGRLSDVPSALQLIFVPHEVPWTFRSREPMTHVRITDVSEQRKIGYGEVVRRASLEPHSSRDKRLPGNGTLWLCIPILRKRHQSLQVGHYSDGVIVGGWQDRHYAWDYPRGEAFRTQVMNGAESDAITEVLDWLESELRRLD
jgi:hypothetical protein